MITTFAQILCIFPTLQTYQLYYSPQQNPYGKFTNLYTLVHKQAKLNLSYYCKYSLCLKFLQAVLSCFEEARFFVYAKDVCYAILWLFAMAGPFVCALTQARHIYLHSNYQYQIMGLRKHKR